MSWAVWKSENCGKYGRKGNRANSGIERKGEERIEFANKEIGKEIEKNDSEELIIGRSKTTEEVNTQIDISADEFRKLEENKEDGEFPNERGGDVLPEEGEMGNPLRENEVDNPRAAELPKVKRREKALPWKVELDLSGKFSRKICRIQVWEIRKQYIYIGFSNPKQQEDVKLYGQLPDYDDSQCYDLGKDDMLRQVAQGIYANSHKPSWRTLKHHLFTVRITKKLSRGVKKNS